MPGGEALRIGREAGTQWQWVCFPSRTGLPQMSIAEFLLLKVVGGVHSPVGRVACMRWAGGQARGHNVFEVSILDSCHIEDRWFCF